jgi:hypothetical protein
MPGRPARRFTVHITTGNIVSWLLAYDSYVRYTSTPSAEKGRQSIRCSSRHLQLSVRLRQKQNLERGGCLTADSMPESTHFQLKSISNLVTVLTLRSSSVSEMCRLCMRELRPQRHQIQQSVLIPANSRIQNCSALIQFSGKPGYSPLLKSARFCS